MATNKDEKAAILRVLDVATGGVSPAEHAAVRAQVCELLGVAEDAEGESDSENDSETSEVV